MEGNGGSDGKKDSNALTLKVIRVRTRIASSVRTGIWYGSCTRTDPTEPNCGDNLTMATFQKTVCS